MKLRELGRRRPSAPTIEVLTVPAAAIVLAIVTTWPLVLILDDHAHDAFDPLFQAWTLDWAQHAIGSGAPLWDANIFAPNQRTLAYSDHLLGVAVLLLPLRWLGLSPIGVQNVGLLLGYASSAVAGYVFGRVVTRSVVVGACTGVVYAFGPYNTFLGQHMNITIHPGPALAATAAWTLADRCSEGRRVAPALVALTAVVALQGTVSFYTATLSIVAGGAVLLARARDLRARGLLRGVLALAAGVVLLLPLAWPYILNSRAMAGDFEWRLADFAVSGADFSSVDPSLTVWGRSLGSPTGIFGQPTFPGVTVIVLTALGLFQLRRVGDRRIPTVALALAVTGLVLAIGTSGRGWRRYAPYRLVYELVPGGTALRGTGRFWLVGLLGVGLLVGLAVRRFTASAMASGGGRRLVAVAVVASCLGLILLEGHRSWADAPRIEVAEVDRVLARLPGDEGVVYLPLPISRDEGFPLLGQAQIVYRSTAHHRPMLNGYAGFYPDDFFTAGRDIADLPAPPSLEHLRRLGVRYIVVPPNAGAWQSLRDPARAEPLRLIGDYDGNLLYEVPSIRQAR